MIKMKTIRIVGMALLSVLMCINFASCNSSDDDNSFKELIIGRWEQIENNKRIDHCKVFSSDGTGNSYTYGENHEWFEWSINGNKLHMTFYNVGKESDGTSYEYQIIKLDNQCLIYNYNDNDRIITKEYIR